MKRNFVLNIKPFSINQMFTLRNFKTVSYRDWQELFLHEVRKASAQDALKDLRNAFDPSKHGVALSLTFYFPKNIMFTAANQLSGRAYDLSNIEKNIIDLLCLPKVHNAAETWGAENFNIDDKFIISLQSKKRVAPDDKFSISVRFSLLSLHPSKP
jgi:hypothetical protein